jgi:HTH-type transcriptional regulator/antitoxin HigA
MPNIRRGDGKLTVESSVYEMTAKYDPQAYADLLVDALPGVIRNEKENERALRIVERLMKKDHLSPEEFRLLDLLATLIETFEEKAYLMGDKSNPQFALRELMREHRLRQTDMLDIFGSQGVVSQVLNGKREISKSQARRLAERFRLPVDIFI